MNLFQNVDIVLASSSSIRKKILYDLGLIFEIVKPDFEEELAKNDITHLSIKEQAIFLATNKALSISKKYPDKIVIASDQICQIQNSIISKSKDFNQAVDQLTRMSGRIHYQNNAVCLYKGDTNLITHFETAKLKMRNLDREEVNNYVRLDQSWGCAGSYKFESLGKHLFENVEGNQDCILGMAIQPIINFLHRNKLISFTNKIS